MLAFRGTHFRVTSPIKRSERCTRRRVASLSLRPPAESLRNEGYLIEKARLGIKRREVGSRSVITTQCAAMESIATSEGSSIDLGTVVVIDNYDSFTYNLSQVVSMMISQNTIR